MTAPKPSAEEVALEIMPHGAKRNDDWAQVRRLIASELRSRDAALEAAEKKLAEWIDARVAQLERECNAIAERVDVEREAKEVALARVKVLEEAVGLLERWYADESPYLDTRVFLARPEIAGVEEARGMSPRPE